MTASKFECCHCGSRAEPNHIRAEQAGRLEVFSCAACGVIDGRLTALGREEMGVAMDADFDYDDDEEEEG